MDETTFLEHGDRAFLARLRQDLARQSDLEMALSGLIEQVNRHLATEAISIFELDEAAGELVIAHAAGPVCQRVVGLRMPMGQGVVGWVVGYNEPLIVPSTDLDPRFYSGIDEKTGFVTRSILCVPILSGDRVRGAVEVLNKTTGSFDDDDVVFLQAVVKMVSEAMLLPPSPAQEDEPLVLEETEVEPTQDERVSIGKVSFSSNISELMEQVNKCLHTEALSIFVLDETSAEMVLEHAAGPVGEEVAGMRIPVGQGVVGWVVKYADPLIVPKPGLDPRFLADVDEQTGFVTRSILCVPIVSGGRTLGAIEVLNKTAGNFDDDDVVFLQDIAQKIGDMIDKPGEAL